VWASQWFSSARSPVTVTQMTRKAFKTAQSERPGAVSAVVV
jgi:thiamine pyrophosphate-dependent acetolactate synthase large subunit-like protein